MWVVSVVPVVPTQVRWGCELGGSRRHRPARRTPQSAGGGAARTWVRLPWLP